MLEKLRDMSNPYDFANPVQSENMFFGRALEVNDLVYYLNHASKTSRPIHLALVGARASGKTSFLNISEIEAKRRNFCCVRMNLNEGDVLSEYAFFRKLFHSVLRAAFQAGAYGGTKGQSYLDYLELTATGTVKNLENIPLPFAILMARAKDSNPASVLVPDDILAEDLATLSVAVKQPILLLLDECNVLRLNRFVLEKLRNVFMNLSGYMLILAATEEFFPVMDEVFSPIMRQFKRVNIGPFTREEDVSDCIRQPLLRSGLELSEVHRLVSPLFVREVAALTAGRPYEIQLICHTLFRRCQDGASKRFSLDLSTLELIRSALASGQNIEKREVVRSAKTMKRKTLEVLDAICNVKERLSAIDHWRLEYWLHGTTRWTQDGFKLGVNELIDGKVVTTDHGKLEFLGDDFDRVYIKYYTRSKQGNVSFGNLGLDVFVFSTVQRLFSQFESIIPIVGLPANDYIDQAASVVEFLTAVDHAVDIYVSPLLEQLIAEIMQFPANKDVRLYEVYYTSDLGSGQFWFLWSEPEHLAGVKKLSKRLEELRERGDTVGVSVQYKHWDIRVPTIDFIVEATQKVGDEQFCNAVGGSLGSYVQDAYVSKKNKGLAVEYAEAALRLTNSRLHQFANNIGYLYMDARNFSEASLWFRSAAQYGDDEIAQLLTYNRGVLSALMEDYGAADDLFTAAKAHKDTGAACAYRLVLSGTAVTFEEVTEVPSIRVLVDEAITTLRSISAPEKVGACKGVAG